MGVICVRTKIVREISSFSPHSSLGNPRVRNHLSKTPCRPCRRFLNVNQYHSMAPHDRDPIATARRPKRPETRTARVFVRLFSFIVFVVSFLPKPSNRCRIGRGGNTYEDETTFRNTRIVCWLPSEAAAASSHLRWLQKTDCSVYTRPRQSKTPSSSPYYLSSKHARTTFFLDCFTHGSGQSCNRLSPPPSRPSLANGRRVS